MDNKDMLFDRRLIERNLRQGTLTNKDYEKFLKSLPDKEGEYEEDSLSSSQGPSSSSQDED
jgi:hypothetical protein